MTEHYFCDCCRAQVSEAEKLCDECQRTLDALRDFPESYQKHALAAAVCHSVRDIARRAGCTPEAHRSALGNGVRRNDLDRQRMVRVAGWAIRVGMLSRPKGFEDCNPSGWAPEHVKGSGEVKVSKTEPTPTGEAPNTKGSPGTGLRGQFRPGERRPKPAASAAPDTDTTPQPVQPGAPGELDSIPAQEPPAPTLAAGGIVGPPLIEINDPEALVAALHKAVPLTGHTLSIEYESELRSFERSDLEGRLECAQDHSRRAFASLGRLILRDEASQQELLQAAYECGWQDGMARTFEKLVEE